MAEQEDFSQLSLPDQFAHKNWKARKGGYETATKEFKTAQPNDPIVREFVNDSSLWKAAVGDSNVAAQQEALSAYNAFLDAAGTEGARKTRSSTVTPIVEKGLTGRPAAKQAALESLLLLIELDKPDPVIEELLPLLSHKLPKVIVPTLSALKEIYHAYGCKTVEPKPVLKLLPKMYGHADKNVRAEAQALTVELYRWLREAMKPLFWGELKPVQQTDLEKMFEPVKEEPTPKQERLLRSQQAAKEVAEAAGGDEDEGDAAEEEDAVIDLEPEFEAVDAFAKLPKDFGERLASAKWKDRKEALDDVFTAVNVPAIQDGNFDEVVRGCAKSMKDANIMVVTVAANCIEALAKGLKKGFAKYRGTILASMLERFKEKKQGVTDAIGAACDAVFLATNLGEIEPDVLEALKSKNPQVKENSAKFLIRSLKTTREPPSLEQTKELAETGKKLLTESAPGLRDSGAEILGVIWKIMTDRNFLNHLEGIDDIKKNKIKEFSDAAEVRAKWKPKAAPPPKPAAPAAKKPALGTKRPGAVKKAAPRPQSPPLVDDAPLAPRPTSRPAAKGAAGLRPPGAGLRAPGSGLQKPGLKATAAGASSPKRQAQTYDDPPATPSTKPRGLASRPLGKPNLAPASPPPQQSSSSASALSSIERQELSDLRAEIELTRQQTSDLRTDKMRLTSQITELQNQNAQLIEDHTRDVLQIKAKETQLVRARGETEGAEDRADGLSREIDRLKREIARLGRAQGAGRESPNGDGYGRNAYGNRQPTSAPRTQGYGQQNGNSSGDNNGYGGNDEGKENVPEYGLQHSSNSSSADLYGKPAQQQQQRPVSHASSGRQTPIGRATPNGRDSNDNYDNGSSQGSSMGPPPARDGYGARERDGLGGSGSGREGLGMGRTQSEGVESWRRAAEVTQNLKARIEMMKARQGLGRGT